MGVGMHEIMRKDRNEQRQQKWHERPRLHCCSQTGMHCTQAVKTDLGGGAVLTDSEAAGGSRRK